MKLNLKKVSVIVPVYNSEKYILRCLQSLVNQTLKDIEIIIVNDGSKDNSKELIQEYINKYPNKIIYYEKENGGLSSARNYGLNFANGEYIGFLDSDDYVEKDMYEKMYEKAIDKNSDIVECDFIWEYKNKSIKDIRRNYKNKRDMLKRPRVVVWNKIYKNEIINNIRFPEDLIYEDLEFFYKIMPYARNVSYIKQCFIHYIQRENSLSNKQTKKTEDIFKILQNILDFYVENNLYNQYKKELKYMCNRILMGSSLRRIIKIKDTQLRKKIILKTFFYLIKFNHG